MPNYPAIGSSYPTRNYPWTFAGSDYQRVSVRLREATCDRFGKGTPKLVAVGDATSPSNDAWKVLEGLVLSPLDGRDSVARVFMDGGGSATGRKLLREFKLSGTEATSISLKVYLRGAEKLWIGLSNDADYALYADLTCYDPFFQVKGLQELGEPRIIDVNPALLPPTIPEIGQQFGTPLLKLSVPTNPLLKLLAYDGTHQSEVPSGHPFRVLFTTQEGNTLRLWLGGDRPVPILIREFIEEPGGGG